MMMVNKKRRNFCQDWVKLAAGKLDHLQIDYEGAGVNHGNLTMSLVSPLGKGMGFMGGVQELHSQLTILDHIRLC